MTLHFETVEQRTRTVNIYFEYSKRHCNTINQAQYICMLYINNVKSAYMPHIYIKINMHIMCVFITFNHVKPLLYCWGGSHPTHSVKLHDVVAIR